MFQPTRGNICWDMQLWLSFSQENEGKQFHPSLEQHLGEGLGLVPFPKAKQILASSAQRNNQTANASVKAVTAEQRFMPRVARLTREGWQVTANGALKAALLVWHRLSLAAVFECNPC